MHLENNHFCAGEITKSVSTCISIACFGIFRYKLDGLVTHFSFLWLLRSPD